MFSGETKLIQQAKFSGVFETWDNLHYSTEDLREICKRGICYHTLDGLANYQKKPNLLMATAKLAMAVAVYSTIDRLVITSQTSDPVETETSYTGVIYTTNQGDEYFRSNQTNPFQIGWNLLTDQANGNYGSFITIDSGGNMINRSLAGGVVKSSGAAKLILFTGSVL